MVISGFTAMLVLFKTELMLLSMIRVVGFPPESDHESVADWPFSMLAGLAVKLKIAGAGILLTVIVTDLATEPPSFSAVRV